VTQELGETSSAMSQNLLKMVEETARDTKKNTPFYIVFHAKADKVAGNAIRQAIAVYDLVPKNFLGILVWYVDKLKGILEFKPDLSSPPDLPVDPSILTGDFSPELATKGKRLHVLAS